MILIKKNEFEGRIKIIDNKIKDIERNNIQKFDYNMKISNLEDQINLNEKNINDNNEELKEIIENNKNELKELKENLDKLKQISEKNNQDNENIRKKINIETLSKINLNDLKRNI